jgi:single-strand DNA-binding protein
VSTPITVVGNVTRDASLRFTPSGDAVCDFGVAVNERKKEGDKWVDGEATFYTVSAWKQLAEDAAGIVKGDRVVVTGTFKARKYTVDSGEKLSLDVKADDIGISILFSSREG